MNKSLYEKYPAVLRIKDLMEIFSISPNTAYSLVRSGQIYSVRVGNSYRIPLEAVIEFLEKP